MEIDSVEFTDEEVYAIENGEEINEGIYSPTYNEQDRVCFEYQLECLLEGSGEIEYFIDSIETAEKDIRGIEALITKSIGKDSFNNIMKLLDRYKFWLKRDYEETWKSYDDLEDYVNKTFK